MSHPIFEYLARDHDRLDALLAEATKHAGEIAPEPFAAFRAGLLRHIGMEEKILLPAARKARGGEQIPEFARLRADHAKLTALLVPTPTPEIVAQLRAILGPHNALEEGPGGVYEECIGLAGNEADALLEKLRSAPEVPVRPHFDGRRPKLLDD